MQMSFITSFICYWALKGVEIQTTVNSSFSDLQAKICNVDWHKIVLASNGVTIRTIVVSLNLVTYL